MTRGAAGRDCSREPVDEKLAVGTFERYPTTPSPVRAHTLARDGTRAVAAWDDEGNHVSADGKTIIPPRDRPGIVVFDRVAGEVLRTLEIAHKQVALSQHGETLLATVITPATAPRGQVLSLDAFSVDDGRQHWSRSGAFSLVAAVPGANLAVAVEADATTATAATLHILDIDTGVDRALVPLPAGEQARALAVSPDGAVVAVGAARDTGASDSSDAHYLLFAVADGTLLRELVFPDRVPLSDLAVSAEGRFVASFVSITGRTPPDASGYVHQLLFWDADAVKSPKPAALWAHYGQALTFSPDSSRLVTTELDGVYVYGTDDLAVLYTASYHKNIF